MQFLSWLEFFQEEPAVHGWHELESNNVSGETAEHDMLSVKNLT